LIAATGATFSLVCVSCHANFGVNFQAFSAHATGKTCRRIAAAIATARSNRIPPAPPLLRTGRSLRADAPSFQPTADLQTFEQHARMEEFIGRTILD